MRLMIVGALEGHISAAGKIALKKGVDVTHCESISQGLNALRSGKGADIVMIDIKQDIAQMIASMEAERIATPVVACGVETDASAAVAAIKAGAKEYVPLPPDAELIAAVLEAVAEENSNMIASSPVMRGVLDMADQIAPSTATVLISGESGTGKELMAKYVHNKSQRKGKSFIALNCAAIPETLLESELFGHEKGAFTGAVARRLGKFEEASGGTLFLDEISEMDISLQAKLLRAIQEREIERIGSNKTVKVDIRLIATTNRDLEHEVKAGTFRQDLYFRLNVVNIDLPSLRDRGDDIPKLAQFFNEKYSEQNKIDVKPISDAAIDVLMQHEWPGNVRELENTMHRAVLMSRGDAIEPDAVMLSGKANVAAKASTATVRDEPEPLPGSANIGKTVAQVEKDLIISTLDHCLGNRTHAANILGISIRTLRNKLKQYNESDAASSGASSGQERHA